MNRFLMLSLMASLVGCGAPESTDDTISTSLDGKEDSSSAQKAALPAGAQHIYFENVASAYASDDAPLSYSWFTANKGTEFKVTVAENDEHGNPIAGEHIGFKLQRATKSGKKYVWTVVDQADGNDGWAGLKFKPGVGPGLYLITATASPLPAGLTINLSCGGSACATGQEPGQACGGLAASHFQCDDGLYCQYTIAEACGAGDQQGVCAVKSQICPLFYRPSCGCDGKTYGNSCQAGSAGTSIARVGECDVNLVGAWEYIATGGAHYDYTFNADGTFVSTEQPGCAFTNPRCLIKISPATGSYTITSSSSVSLFYSSDSRNGESATFAIQKKGTHLVGTDWSASLDLTRLK